MPITPEMFAIVAGTGKIGEAELKLIRNHSVKQFGAVVSKLIREEFLDFYTKEVKNARKMGT